MWHILENAKKNLSKQYTKRFAEIFNILVYKVMNEEDLWESTNAILKRYL